MPATLTFPGVYIEEIPSGVRTIVGVATSITAFIGAATRGPTNDPVVINSNGDFERVFGGLSTSSSLGFAVRDFFLNGGSQAIIVRVTNGGAPAELPVDGLALTAANDGAWGNNLSVTVDYNTKDPADGKLFNMTITEIDSVTNQTIRTESLLNVSIDPANARFVPAVVKDDSLLVQVKKNSVVPGARPGAGTYKATAGSGK